MSMTFPADHTPRFSDFIIDGVLDETLREGSERCMFSVATDDKLPLIRSIMATGVKDLIFGSGPNDPGDMATVLAHLEKEQSINDQNFSFILLLNCFEPLMEQFEHFPEELKRYVTISFGMITHDSEHSLFERTLERFRKLGFESFRVSLLNKFTSEVHEHTYSDIVSQIDRSRSQGIETIRINDSLETIYPEAMAILAANLRHDYPDSSFCLHAHNDRGFGLQNALNSIYHGFNLIEGGFADFGNRSGLPAIEVLSTIFSERNIRIKSGDLNQAAASNTARLAEQTFLVLPSLFRPVSGHIVDCENMGVTNIPDYLGASSASRYFLNRIGLHEPTVEQLVRDSGLSDEQSISKATMRLQKHLTDLMRETTIRKTFEYHALVHMIQRFYDDDVLFSDRVQALADDFLSENHKILQVA